MTSNESFCVVVANEPHPFEDAGVESPASHIVDVDAEDEAGEDVETGEEDPKPEVALQDPDGAHKDDESLLNHFKRITTRRRWFDGK